MLPLPRLAFRELDGHSGVTQATADGTKHVLFFGGLQDVVVLDIGRVWGEANIAPSVRFVVGLLEQEELDLRTDLGLVPLGHRSFGLALQNATGRLFDRRTRVDVDQIEENNSCLFKPRKVADRCTIDHSAHVAVALVVAGKPEPGHRVVVDVACDQIVTVLGALLRDDIEIELTICALTN